MEKLQSFLHPHFLVGQFQSQGQSGGPAWVGAAGSSLGGLSCQLFDPLRGDSGNEMEAVGPGLLIIALRPS